jgi:hypothetical protein
MVCQLSLSPLGPNKVRARACLFFAFRNFLFFTTSLTDKALPFLFVPPTPSFHYLPYTWVVVASSNIKFKEVGTLLRLHVSVLLIKNFVQFLHELNVYQAVELRLF